MKNSADLGGCYPPRPSASVDNTLLDLKNSSYPTQPHSIIANYSRVIKGKQSTSFDHTIFNVIDVVDNHNILYFENLNLNGYLIDGLGDPEDLANATNKKYVDTENARQDITIADKVGKSYVDNNFLSFKG